MTDNDLVITDILFENGYQKIYCINLVITDIYNLKMAVISSDVFCSFRFIEFESGSHYTVCTAVHKTSLQYSCTQKKVTE